MVSIVWKQQQKKWIVTDKRGTEFLFSSLTDARNWMDYLENLEKRRLKYVR